MRIHKTFPVLGFLFLPLSLCLPTQLSHAQDNLSTSAPCWFEAPAEGAPIGQIGVSRSIAVGKYTAKQISQLRAADALCHSRTSDACSDQAIQEAIAQERLLGKPIYFAYYERGGYIYSYASFEPAPTKTCPPSPCNLGSCKPAWLCNPSTKEQSGLLGVSFQATSVAEQYQSAIANGLLQAEYLYGVNITASKELRSTSSGVSSYRFLSEASVINASGEKQITYYLANQCRHQSTLYTRIVLNHVENESPTVDSNDISWIKNPKLNGIDGAVGAVENLVASGLLSDQINLAIERAAVQLAFEKYTEVSEQSLQVTRSTGGIIRISNIKENTQVDLHARVLKIHFGETPGEHVKVYAWLAAIKQ